MILINLVLQYSCASDFDRHMHIFVGAHSKKFFFSCSMHMWLVFIEQQKTARWAVSVHLASLLVHVLLV